MLAVALLFTTTGFTLIYAGVKGGDYWRQPWKPYADWLNLPKGAPAAEPIPGQPTTTG